MTTIPMKTNMTVHGDVCTGIHTAVAHHTECMGTGIHIQLQLHVY